MQASSQAVEKIDLTKYHSLVKVENAFLHQFSGENHKQLIDISDCQILQYINVEGTQVPSHVLKLGSFTYQLDNCTCVKAIFQNLVTFIFQNKQNQSSIYLVSLETYNPNLQHFSQVLSQSTHLIEYKTDNYEKSSIRDRVTTACNGDLTQELIEDVGSFSGILKTVGNILGSVSKNVIDPTLKAQNMFQSSVQNFSDKYVSDINRGRWNNVKQTASSFNEKMTQMYKPIDTAFKNIVASIGQNFNKSENKYIQNLIKYGKATAKTLNNSYKKAEQTALGQQSKQNQQTGFHETSTNNLTVNQN